MRRVPKPATRLSPIAAAVALAALATLIACDLGPGETSTTRPNAHEPFLHESGDDEKETDGDGARGPLEIDFGGDGRFTEPLASFRGHVTGTDYEVLSMKSGEDATIRFDVKADGVPYRLVAKSIFHGIRWTIYDPRGEVEQSFSYSRQYPEDGVEVITEETDRESMTIHRRTLWDGRVEERYVHSTAGERIWIRPSNSHAPPGFKEEYREWFPAHSELSQENRLAATCMEIYHSTGFSEFLDEVNSRLEDSSGSLSAQRIPWWVDAVCSGVELCALMKCTFGGGPVNAVCAFCAGGVTGCFAAKLLYWLYG